MQKKQWLHAAVTLALLRALTLSAYAQEGLPAAAVSGEKSAVHSSRFARSGGFGFEGQMSKAVGLTPEQRDAVKGLMAEQRQQRTAIQEQTDGKIRALLNPDQQKKFDAFLAEQKQMRSARFHKAS